MRRVVSVWFPHWPTDRLRRRLSPPPEPGPLVTAIHDGRRRVIAAADAGATALGLRPGQAMTQALAMLPDLQVFEAEPDADADALTRLALWCHRYTPLVSACQPDGLWLEVGGAAHLFGGEAALLENLLRRLVRDGVHACAALADTPGAAHAVARYGQDRSVAPGHAPPLVVPPGEQASAVATLPVAALRLAPELDATLRRLGFERIAHLNRIPRALLARRFGPLPALRLDQIQGCAAEPLVPLPPQHLLQRRMSFLEPLLTAEALAVAIERLVEPLCDEMEQAGLGARRLDLLFERVDRQMGAIRIGTARPTRDAPHLSRLLQERLDTIDPGLGVEAMQLLVPLADPLAWEQQDSSAGPQAVGRLVDRLVNRLGPDRVYSVEPVESRMPEQAVRKTQAAPPDSDALGRGISNRQDGPRGPGRNAAPLVQHRPAIRSAVCVEAGHEEPDDATPARTRRDGLKPAKTLTLVTGGLGLRRSSAKNGSDPCLHLVEASQDTTTSPAAAVPQADLPRVVLPWKPRQHRSLALRQARSVGAWSVGAWSVGTRSAGSPGVSPDDAKTGVPAAWPGRLKVPTRLLSPPRPVNAIAGLPDQPPRVFTWRRRHKVRRAEGPERIHEPWWSEDGESEAIRDYYQVEVEDGQRFWLFRQGNGLDPLTGNLEWFLHGIF